MTLYPLSHTIYKMNSRSINDLNVEANVKAFRI